MTSLLSRIPAQEPAPAGPPHRFSSPSVRTDRVLRGLETCVRAIAELSTSLRNHPLSDAFACRSALHAAVRLSKIDGILVDEARIAGHLALLQLPAMADKGAERRAIGRARRLLALSASPWPKTPPETDEKPPLMGSFPLQPAGKGPALFAVAAQLYEGRSNLMTAGLAHERLPASLAMHGLVPSPILLVADQVHRTGSERPDLFLAAFLEALEADAVELLGLLRTLTLSWKAWHGRAGERRSNSRLPLLIDQAAASPILTPAGVARRFGCTVRAANMMLEELVALGILEEISGRRTWKAYAGIDFASLKEDIEVRRAFVAPKAPRDDHDDWDPKRSLPAQESQKPIDQDDVIDATAIEVIDDPDGRQRPVQKKEGAEEDERELLVMELDEAAEERARPPRPKIPKSPARTEELRAWIDLSAEIANMDQVNKHIAAVLAARPKTPTD